MPPDATPGATAVPSGGVGKPTHLEVTADKATVNRANSTGVFQGHVTGFYQLQGTKDPFNFKGDQATVKFDAAAPTNGLSVVVTGAPVDVEVPAFDFNF